MKKSNILSLIKWVVLNFFLIYFVPVCAAEDVELVILSCGGGGTHYVAQCFQQSELDLGHEIFKEYGYIGWPLVGGPYYYHGSPLDHVASARHIFHQVRNPLNVIACWMNISLDHPAWQYVRANIDIQHDEPQIVQCAKYWYYWNLKAESQAEWRYRVEDFLLILDEFERRLQITLNREAILAIPTNTGSWGDKRHIITWDRLERELPQDLYSNIKNMALRYGYVLNAVSSEK